MIPTNFEQLSEILHFPELPSDEGIQTLMLKSVQELLREHGENYFETPEGKQEKNLLIALSNP